MYKTPGWLILSWDVQKEEKMGRLCSLSDSVLRALKYSQTDNLGLITKCVALKHTFFIVVISPEK